MSNLYRQSSIEKLSNPDQLDRAISISSPMSWIALIGVAIIIVATILWAIFGSIITTISVNAVLVAPANTLAIYSDYSGIISEFFVDSGTHLNAGDKVAEVKINEGEIKTIYATHEGTVSAILFEENSQIYVGTEIARLTPDLKQDNLVVCFVPAFYANQLKTNMAVLLYPTSIDSQKYGHMEAQIAYISEYSINTNNMWYILGNQNLVAEQFVSDGPVISVVCKIKEDSMSKSGYYWSNDNGNELSLSNGTFMTAKIVTDECAPITKFISTFRDKLEA